MSNQSEVARWKREIVLRSEAALQGLYGYAEVSRHEFITRRMEAIGECHEALEQLVGTEEASRIVIETYIEVVENQDTDNNV